MSTKFTEFERYIYGRNENGDLRVLKNICVSNK